jgi:hypothetical protein
MNKFISFTFRYSLIVTILLLFFFIYSFYLENKGLLMIVSILSIAWVITYALIYGKNIDAKNRKICSCCGQMRDYPTEPGNWEFKDFDHWRKVTIVRSTGKETHEVPEGELLLYLEGSDKPEWWPNNAQWRKL